jgi:O-acetyl-ADP-ribose deacetylase (regulator of RNase III)
MNRLVLEEKLPGGAMLQLVQGDLTEERVDAIVNAANAHLAHGGGVAGAIVRQGGRQIQRESDAWVQQHGPVSNVAPAYTSAGNLPATFVIHAVGPVWGEGDEDAKLTAAVQGALRRADELALQSVALPAISTGIFGFPKARAAGVILAALRDYFTETPTSGLRHVRLVLFDNDSVAVFTRVWKAHER